MILVYILDKALDSCLLDELLLVEAALSLDEVASDAGHQQVGEAVFLNVERRTLLPV